MRRRWQRPVRLLLRDRGRGRQPRKRTLEARHEDAAGQRTGAVAAAGQARRQIDGLVDALGERGVIEQCTAVMMLCWGIEKDAAFELLTWRSQQTEVEVRVLAAQVMRQVATLTTVPATAAAEFGALFMSAHTRIDS